MNKRTPRLNNRKSFTRLHKLSRDEEPRIYPDPTILQEQDQELIDKECISATKKIIGEFINRFIGDIIQFENPMLYVYALAYLAKMDLSVYGVNTQEDIALKCNTSRPYFTRICTKLKKKYKF